jgi:Raf kinase inhibitor-like YbhB/YbcL family protein
MMLSGTATPGFALTSSAFQEGSTFPTEFTCAVTGQVGSGVSPPLAWSGAPGGARSFALVEQDMDVPPPNGPVVHWMIYNIPASEMSLTMGVPNDETLANGARQGLNARRTPGYLGSCPPPGAAPHHYVFQLFALDNTLSLPAQASVVDLQPAMQGHILAQTRLQALFGR